jgi:hypothetical protein
MPSALRRLVSLLLLLTTTSLSFGASSTTISAPALPDPEEEQIHDNESEGLGENTGIIPRNAGILSSTDALTPVSELPEKEPYKQSVEELEQAKKLWSKGYSEAASDMALQAYEDLLSIKGPRGKRHRKKRAKIRQQRAQAATIYVDASISYLRHFVKSKGDTPTARAEGRARLEDLRDVARDYSELNSKLNRALEQMR